MTPISWRGPLLLAVLFLLAILTYYWRDYHRVLFQFPFSRDEMEREYKTLIVSDAGLYNHSFKEWSTGKNRRKTNVGSDRNWLPQGTLAHKGYSTPNYNITRVVSRGVHTIRDLCVEEDSSCVACSRDLENSSRLDCRCSSRLVAYNSRQERNLTLTVRMGPHGTEEVREQGQRLRVEYRRGRVPPGHRINNQVPTFFVAHTCPGNLNHFWDDAFIGLHGLMSMTGRLGVPEGNQVVYRRDEWGLDPQGIARYQKILYSLSVLPGHDWWRNLPTNYCMSTAVVGFKPLDPDGKVAGRYVRQQLLSDKIDCPPRQVTILQRSHRRILNVEEVLQSAIDAGFRNAKVFTFENLGIDEQLKVIQCTDILVGVHGAGLEWFSLMKEDGGLIEISWPGWNGYYARRASKTSRGRRVRELTGQHAQLNWETYALKVNKGEPVSDGKKRSLLMSPSSEIWKWSDVHVNTKAFKQVLAGL